MLPRVLARDNATARENPSTSVINGTSRIGGPREETQFCNVSKVEEQRHGRGQCVSDAFSSRKLDVQQVIRWKKKYLRGYNPEEVRRTDVRAEGILRYS